MIPSLFVFDFDGTIADTFLLIVEISNRLSGEFGYRRIEPGDLPYMKGLSTQEVIRFLKIPFMKIPVIVSRAKKEFQSELKNIQPVTGIHDCLLALKKQGIKLGILSSNSGNNVEDFLRHHDMDVFDFINSTPRIWGKHHSLNALLKDHQLAPQDLLYIGDEIRDITAAQKSGVQIAAVSWGYNSGEALAKHHPNFLLQTPQDLLTLPGQ